MDTPDKPDAPVIEKPRRFKWLRIAVSAVFVVLTVGFAALRAQSYSWVDSVYVSYSQSQCLEVESFQGQIRINIRCYNLPEWWSLNHVKPISGFILVDDNDQVIDWAPASEIRIHYWSFILLSATLAYAPWLAWRRIRFSLKALMLFTTVIAILLGLVTWLMRG